MDTVTRESRSANMRRIKSENTKPELVVRRLVYRLGYRYRLHRRDLPGKPDLVFPSQRRVIFVHGCFWHQHGPCSDSRIPKSRRSYWVPKLRANKRRDVRNYRRLRRLNWSYLVVWECQIGRSGNLVKKIEKFLES